MNASGRRETDSAKVVGVWRDGGLQAMNTYTHPSLQYYIPKILHQDFGSRHHRLGGRRFVRARGAGGMLLGLRHVEELLRIGLGVRL